MNTKNHTGMMTHRERFFATLQREPVDRPACWLGMPTTEAIPSLLQHFDTKDETALKQRLNDDVWPIDVPYACPPANHIACAFDFAKDACDYEHRTLTSPGFFEDMTDPDAVNQFEWPDPKQHIDPEACRQAAQAAPDDYACLGIMWSANFQDTCAAFGMENALMTMITDPDMFLAVYDRITEFYLEANEIFYKATEGDLHAVLLGNDFGSQTGLMLSREHIQRLVIPGIRKLIDQAHGYGLKVIYHSCGAIADIIPDLIDAGVDVIHPIQAKATGMEPECLKQAFGEQVAFCGGVDAQELLVNGKPEDVTADVTRLRNIFPTGLIISPSHEAILPDIAPGNIEALFQAMQKASNERRHHTGGHK